MLNISMLLNTSWCGFTIKINMSLVQVLIIKKFFFTFSLNAEVPPSVNAYLTVIPICVATRPVLSSENKILLNFANLWNIQNGDFKKLFYQIKIIKCFRFRINEVIILSAVFAMFPTNNKIINNYVSI